MIEANLIRGMFFGIAVGDALGVPVEFIERSEIRNNPVTGMKGFGTFNQLPGTWSDDASLSFCLAESCIAGYSAEDLANRFILWLTEGYWTARGDAFDVGYTTQVAIEKILHGVSPYKSGESGEFSNGNGALMRIAPLIFCIRFTRKTIFYYSRSRIHNPWSYSFHHLLFHFYSTWIGFNQRS